MTQNISMLTKVFLSVFFIAASAVAQGDFSFAEELMKQKDYFRAITQYKQIHFYSQDSLEKSKALFSIGRAYYLSKKYKSSIYYLTRLLNQKSQSNLYKSKGNLYLGLNYYKLKVYSMTIDFLDRSSTLDKTGNADLMLALLESERGRWDLSSKKFKLVADTFTDQPSVAIAQQLT